MTQMFVGTNSKQSWLVLMEALWSRVTKRHSLKHQEHRLPNSEVHACFRFEKGQRWAGHRNSLLLLAAVFLGGILAYESAVCRPAPVGTLPGPPPCSSERSFNTDKWANWAHKARAILWLGRACLCSALARDNVAFSQTTTCCLCCCSTRPQCSFSSL